MEVRVLSWNVHAWQDRWRRSNTRRVAALLRQLRPHILCLQEVHARPRWFADDFGAEGEEDPKGTDLSLLQSLLALPLEGETLTEDGWPWAWEWLCLAEAGGSAVASRLPVTHRHLHRLPTPSGQDRPLVGLRVETGGPLGAVDIFSVHLDHLHESRRMAQIESLVAYLDEAGCGPLRALLGDFNALSREDYDDGEWARIGVRRQGARLDPPSAEATELLRRLGYTDVRHTTTATAHDHNDEDDPLNKVDGTEAGDDDDDDEDYEDEDDEGDEEVEAHTEGWTCWAGTRVDYAWLSNDQRAVVDARLRVVPDLTISDHRPLLLSLRLPPSPPS